MTKAFSSGIPKRDEPNERPHKQRKGENNMKKTSKIVVMTVIVALLFCSTFAFVGCIVETKETFQAFQRMYTANEWKKILESSFAQLNTVDHGEIAEKRKTEDITLDERFVRAVNSFAYSLYAELQNSNGAYDENFFFSPFGSYSNLTMLSLAAHNDVVDPLFDGVLGLDRSTRKEQFARAYKKDYFINDDGTLQIYNGSFQTSFFKNYPEYARELAECYCEAFQANFLSDDDVSKILEWIDARMGETGMMTKEDLELQTDTVLLMLTLVYFKNGWSSNFATSDSYEDTFYGKTEKRVTYMKHTYVGRVYDHGDYVTCYDYYKNGLKVKYVVSKEREGDIFALTKGVDLLEKEDEKRIANEGNARGRYAPVELSVPKFTAEYKIDLTAALRAIGLDYIFDKSKQYDCFNNVFTDTPEEFYSYVQYTKQKNKISFDESGTTAKSLTASMLIGGCSAAEPSYRGDAYVVKLENPFIYIIYDSNDLPLFIGHVTMPNG